MEYKTSSANSRERERERESILIDRCCKEPIEERAGALKINFVNRFTY